MLISVRSFAKLFSSVAFAASAVIVSPASAQTPQLLPYGPVVVIAGGAASSPAKGAKCGTAATPTSTDAFGDGCLATQISLTGPRFAITDTSGNVFFADYTNNLVRRIDATTGIVSAVAGGATTSPANGTACGTGLSTDIFGDGCLSTLVALSKPVAMAFSAAGDLYFVDSGHDVVRKIAATSGLVPATGGIITNIAGYAPTTGAANYGFVVSNSTTSINSATASYIDGPYGLAFDANGNLFISEEYKNAVYAVNLNTTSQTIFGVTLKPGEIWKVVGSTTAAGTPTATSTPATCPNGTTGTYGCNYASYVEGAAAGANYLDSPYGLAYGNSTLYIANEYNNVVPQVSSAGLLTTFAGNQSGYGSDITKRATAGSFGIGSDFGLATDSFGDLYVTDSLSGVVWRVDNDTKTMYVVAGGGATGCTTATDTANDGCLAKQATFGKSGTKYATAASPGIFGVGVDQYDNLYIGDSLGTSIREVGNGTNFGITTSTTVLVHYFKGDSPKANGYVIGSGPFTIGAPANCTLNTDGSQDCPLPITSKPTTLGPYSGTLVITSTTGGPVTYPLVGVFAPTPVTTTAVTVAPTTGCTTTYPTGTAITLTANITSVGGNVTGTVQFYANNVAIGQPVTPSSNVATTTFTPTAAGTYTIKATYSGDTYYLTSTGTASPALVVTVPLAPAIALATITNTQGPINAGQTALFSFSITTTNYAGNTAFSCTGLPANSTCVFSPSVYTSSACTGVGATVQPVVALSIFTRGTSAIGTSGIAGRGPWQIVLLVVGLGSALLIGFRRRQLGMRFGSIGMALALLLASSSGLMSCSSGQALPRTPSGAYQVTVTALPSGTATVSAPIAFTLTVN